MLIVCEGCYIKSEIWTSDRVPGLNISQGPRPRRDGWGPGLAGGLAYVSSMREACGGLKWWSYP